MFEPVKIAPSILSADFMNFEKSIKTIESDAGFIHFDVMDGHFVPNITVGVPLLKQLAKHTNIPLDVHLMVSNPLIQIPWFINAGADIITVHAETLKTPDEMQQAINIVKDACVRVCFALKPNTPVSEIEEFIPQLDMVLVMSVEPGFSGQSYIEGSDKKIEEIVRIARMRICSPLIEVDGGINAQSAALVASAGADVLVAGNAVFGAPDPSDAICEIAKVAAEAQMGVCG